MTSRLLSLFLFAGALAHGAATVVTNGTAEPAQVRTGQATVVRFYADIGNPNLIAGSVNLQKTGAAGTNPTVVGTLKDDGTGGDEIAGDGRYSLAVTINERAATTLTYVISAALKGQIVRQKSDNITVTVMANRPPVAVAGPDRAVRTTTPVLLDGRQSYDLDGDLLGFSWAFVSKPNGSQATLDNSTFVKPAFTPDVAGTYKLRLLVNDGLATSAPSDLTVVASATNAAPTAVISGPLLGNFGAGPTKTVVLSGAGSSDPENTALTYSWKFLGQPASSSAPTFTSLTSATPALTADKPGRYVVELTVSDGVNTSTPATATVILYNPNTPPVTTISSDLTVTGGNPVALSSTATDPDGGDSVASRQWAFIARPQGSTAQLVNPATLTPSFTPDVNGDYLIEFTATDSHGFLTRSRVVIRRAAPVVSQNQAPTVNAGQTQTITLPGIATLAATASDDGLPNPPAALTISWIAVSGPTGVTFSNPSSLNTTATFYAPGSFVLRVTASDGALSASSDITITVNDTGPVLSAIPDRTISVGDNFRLSLTASTTNPAAALTFSLPNAPNGALLNPSPAIDWTPTAAQVGSNLFTAKVMDGHGRSDMKSFHVTVVTTNHPPVLADQADAMPAVGSTFTRTLSATDPDAGAVLTYALVSGPAGMTISGNTLNWLVNGTPYTAYAVLCKVTDQLGASDLKKFLVTPVPSAPPVANDDSYLVTLGQTLTVPAPGVLQNDVNPSGLTLTAQNLTLPPIGTLNTFLANGGFSYTGPAALPGKVFQPVVQTHVNYGLYNGKAAVQVYRPVAGDLDGDQKPEIVAGLLNVGGTTGIAAFRGDGSVLWIDYGNLPAPNNDCELNYFAQTPLPYAIGDVDDDGKVDVVSTAYCTRDGSQVSGRLIALNGADGTVKWVSERLALLPALSGAPKVDMVGRASPTIARMHAGESPSILISLFNNGGSGTIGVDASNNPVTGWACNFYAPNTNYPFCEVVLAINGTDGTVRQRMSAPRPANGFDGSPAASEMPPMALDLDQDGQAEIVAGSTTFAPDGTVKYQTTAGSPVYRTTAVAAANLDDTPDIEVVRLQLVNSISRLAAYKPNGALLWETPVAAATVNGPLTIADVDSSGKPTILMTVNELVYAYDHNGVMRWLYNNADHPAHGAMSSPGARVAAFDLDGDGEMEVVLQTSTGLVFLAGATGEVKSFFPYTAIPDSGTPRPSIGSQEIDPIIFDADNDGHADILVFWLAVDAGSVDGRFTVVKNVNNDWEPIRRIQNQAAYYYGNINDDGTIPAFPPANNFANPALNVFGGTQPRIGPVKDPRTRYRTSFTYNANTGPLSSNTATVNLDIAPANRPPEFTSTPPTRFYKSCCTTFTYTATAVDPDPGDTVTFSILWDLSLQHNCTIGATTGVVTCLSYGGANTTDVAQLTLKATDSFGAYTLQTLLLTGTTVSAVVPNVIGLTQAAATAAIQSAGLGIGKITLATSAAAEGTVTGQSPATGSLLGGELVALTVSKGPAPAQVPFVTGLSQTVANTTLATAGFTPNVTHVFSDTVPLNTVVSQSPAAGTLLVPTPANPVTLTVSAGNGLLLTLNRSVITSDQSITVVPAATDVNGQPVATPALTYTIAPDFTPYLGSLPTIAGTTITASLATRGSFTVTAHDAANNRTAASSFYIGPPHVDGAPTHLESFAKMMQALDQIYALRPQLVAARNANNTAQMKSLLQEMVVIWRTVDIDDVRRSLPNVPDDKFMPRVSDLQALGQTITPQDQLVHQILKDANADLLAFTDGLKAPATSLIQLQNLADHFSTRAARMTGLTVTEIGGVYNGHEYTEFLAHRTPEFFEALMEELAELTGLGRRTPGFPYLRNIATSPEAMAAGPHNGRQPQSTLAELTVTIATDFVIDKVMDYASTTFRNARQMAVDTLGQAAFSAVAVTVASHLRSTLGGQKLEDVGAVISGASLSFREFSEPDLPANATPPGLVEWSVIEAPADSEYPDLTSVIIIGPSTLDDAGNGVKTITNGIGDAMSIGKDLATNPLRAKNLNDIKKKFDDLYKALTQVRDGAINLTDVVKNAYQSPDDVLAGCIFSADANCTQLIYSDGIRPVYRYTPPPGFGGLGGLPVAILVIVQNDYGEVYIGTPVFLPAPVRP